MFIKSKKKVRVKKFKYGAKSYIEEYKKEAEIKANVKQMLKLR